MKKIKEPKALNKVQEFHNTFNHPIKKNPEIPSEERSNLRISLIEEELNELKDAIKNYDIIEIADALTDLQYVLSGAILEFGLKDKFCNLFDEVHRSNMSKVCYDIDTVNQTIEFYKQKGINTYYNEKDGLYLIYRKEDNKVLKSIKYFKPDISKFL